MVAIKRTISAEYDGHYVARRLPGPSGFEGGPGLLDERIHVRSRADGAEGPPRGCRSAQRSARRPYRVADQGGDLLGLGDGDRVGGARQLDDRRAGPLRAEALHLRVD